MFIDKLNELNHEKKYIMFFHNIEDEEFYKGELGSEDRQARNVNIISIFSNLTKIKEFSTSLFIQDVIKNDETKDLSINQRLLYMILNNMYETYIDKLKLERVIDELKFSIDSQQDVLKNIVANCEEFSFLNNFKDQTYIDLINEYANINYPSYINFMMDKSFSYTLVEKNALICLLFLSNTLYSLYACIPNINKKLDVFIAELTEEEFILYVNICTPDFQLSMNEDASKEDYPQYKLWKKMEVDFYKSINNKKIEIISYLTESLDNKLDINKIKSNVDLNELF